MQLVQVGKLAQYMTHADCMMKLALGCHCLHAEAPVMIAQRCSFFFLSDKIAHSIAMFSMDTRKTCLLHADIMKTLKDSRVRWQT